MKKHFITLEYIEKKIQEKRKIDCDLVPKFIAICLQEIEDRINDKIRAILQKIATRTGENINNIKEYFGNVVLLKELRINAGIPKQSGSKKFEIHISEGLIIFTYKLLKFFIGLIKVMSDYNIIIEEKTKDYDSNIKILKKLLNAAIVSKDYYHIELFKIETYDISDFSENQLTLALYLKTYSEFFIVAHECSHIVFMIYEDKLKEEYFNAKKYAKEKCEPFLKENGYPLSEINKILNCWIEEFTVDLFGLKLCLDLSKDDHKMRLMIYSSIEWLLSVFNLLEIYVEKKEKNNQKYLTHPPSRFRVDFLQEVVRNAKRSKSGQVGLGFKEFIDHFLSSLLKSLNH